MKTIDEDIRTGSLKQFYLLYGPEGYLKKQYRDKLKDALLKADGASGGMPLPGGGVDSMNFSAFQGKEIRPGEIIDLAETLPFFAERRVILVEDSGFFKNACEELAAYLPGTPPTTYFIFVEEEADKRTKMYKAVKKAGRAVEFATQDEKLLTRWVLARLKKEDKRITSPVMRLFLERTGTDMGNIDRELEKLLCYAMGRDVIEAEDVMAVTAERPENRIFEMIDAVAEHDQKKALKLYDDLLALKEPPMRILYLLMRQFRILFLLNGMAGRGLDRGTMAKRAGIPEFALRRNLAQARGFSAEKLRLALEEGAGLEEAVKTGRLNERMAVEMFLVRYSAV